MRVGASVRVVTPSATRTYEATVADMAASAIDRVIECPVEVEIVAVFARPKRLAMVYKKTGQPKHDTGRIHCPQIPDADNIAKCLLDGMRAVWRDDRQVVRLKVCKVYASMSQDEAGRWSCEPAKVEVVVTTLDGGE